MTEHIRRKGALAIFEQMWRSSEQEVARLEAENERLRAHIKKLETELDCLSSVRYQTNAERSG